MDNNFGYRGFSILALPRAEGWWAEIHQHQRFVAVNVGGVQATMVKAEQAAKLTIDRLCNGETPAQLATS